MESGACGRTRQVKSIAVALDSDLLLQLCRLGYSAARTGIVQLETFVELNYSFYLFVPQSQVCS